MRRSDLDANSVAVGHVESQTILKETVLGKNKETEGNRVIMHPQTDSERLFVMQHMINSMFADVSTLGENVWYVDSGASNHMTGHGEWFIEMQNLERPG